MNNIKENIKLQQEVAKEVLHKLEAIDPYCILAGGAPRNWFLGMEAKDLDFYIHNEHTVDALMTQMNSIGLNAKMVDFKSDDWKEYGVMEHLFRILEVEYKGITVQIMCMRVNTFNSVVSAFGVSICKFWWKGKDVIPTNEALISILEETLYIKDDYSAKEIHVDKMIKYFPNYKVKLYSDYTKPNVKYSLEYDQHFCYYSEVLKREALAKLKEA